MKKCVVQLVVIKDFECYLICQWTNVWIYYKRIVVSRWSFLNYKINSILGFAFELCYTETYVDTKTVMTLIFFGYRSIICGQNFENIRHGLYSVYPKVCCWFCLFTNTEQYVDYAVFIWLSLVSYVFRYSNIYILCINAEAL